MCQALFRSLRKMLKLRRLGRSITSKLSSPQQVLLKGVLSGSTPSVAAIPCTSREEAESYSPIHSFILYLMKTCETFEKVITEQCHESWLLEDCFRHHCWGQQSQETTSSFVLVTTWNSAARDLRSRS